MEKKKEKISLKDLFKKAKKPIKKKHSNFYIETLENLYDKYNDKFMFKVVLSDEIELIEIYSSNFKTTLNKAKKSKKDETIDAEIIEKE